MSGTAPQPPDDPRTPPDAPADDDGPAQPRGRDLRGWWLLAVLVVVAVVLLVWRPWAAEPAPTPTVTSQSPTPTPSPSPTTSPTPSPSLTSVPAPGADAVFDATTAGTLFVTAADVERAVPGASSGVTRGVEPGTRPWGLPEGSVVEPASCTTAVTVVDQPPAHHDATSWFNDEVMIDQDVVVLLDAAAARAAFRALVTTLDECPQYAQVDPGVDGPRWTADPALEGQGVFPAIVHDVTVQIEGDSSEQTAGHVLVGNAIVTWTATALTATDREEAREAIGEPEELSAMIEERALAAVRAMS
ncbi:hypothetical protein [Cellulomonas sp. S1-8]|uniref:hypothetical protein n=1 Tax=Cellulomonas sp. S1-8 TaxID=2904790 RepID=UPI002244456B|nr:hypothetical protein [Cellulomonas sp. S1-8]UZN04558.1 hypothetical protein OKX07_06485 [Cellulomonas sp. S1-8]